MNNNLTLERKLEILNSIKPIPFLPKIKAITIAMTAAYFECDSGIIGPKCSVYKGNGVRQYTSTDLELAGYKVVLEGKDYTCSCRGKTIICNAIRLNGGMNFVEPEGLCKLAERLTKSPIAAEYQKIISQLSAEIPSVSLDISDVIPDFSTSEPECVSEPENAIVPYSYEADAVYDSMENFQSNNIRNFTHAKFGGIRTILKDNTPWFVGKDVAAALGYSNPRDALAKHVFEEDKDGVAICDSIGRKQITPIINESGLYSLILSSKLPSAKEFKRWITAEVLPDIRKHGMYATPMTIDSMLSNPDAMIKILTAYKNERDARVLAEEAKAKAEENLLIAEQGRKNAELRADALSEYAKSWEYESVINALVRMYGSKCKGGRMDWAWNEAYRQLSYKHHIDIKKRKEVGEKSTYLSKVKPDELPLLAQVAFAMCEEAGLDAVKIVNEVNAKNIA